MHDMTLEGIARTLLINALRMLKDEEYQRRVWFRNEGPEVSSYIDTGVSFIGDAEMIFDTPNSEEALGKETYNLIKKLYGSIIEHIDRVEERIDPDLLTEDELLNDPKWHDIQMLAEDLNGKLSEFLKRSKNEQET